MADFRLPLTDRNVANLPFPLSGWYLARDAELGGFFVQVGLRAKTFMIQADLRRDGRRSTIRMKVAAVGDMSSRYKLSHISQVKRLAAGGIYNGRGRFDGRGAADAGGLSARGCGKGR